MTWVKICGTTNLRDAEMSVAAGADALGFIFAPSPRQVSMAQAAEIVAALPNEIEKIGAFVNQTPASVAEVAERVGLTGVQLHGDEPVELLPHFRQMLGKRKLIKTLQVAQLVERDSGKQRLREYLNTEGCVDAILLDSGSPKQRGGTGAPFPWEEAAPVAAAIQAALPLIIAGGLNADNVEAALRRFNPWGVDVVSGVEAEPGVKDEEKLQSFVAAVRTASDRVQTQPRS